jgi:hypothetical protein
MNYATTLMASHACQACPGFTLINANHELCHYADDVTRMPGLHPTATGVNSNITEELRTLLVQNRAPHPQLKRDGWLLRGDGCLTGKSTAPPNSSLMVGC